MFSAWQDLFGRLVKHAAQETGMSKCEWVLKAVKGNAANEEECVEVAS